MNLRKSDSQSGFSLVEILVSMVIMGGLTTSVFYFLSAQNGAGARSTDLLKSLNAGKLAMDDLNVVDYLALEAGSDTLSDRYIRSWRISLSTDIDGNPTGRKKIEMSVHWPLTADHTLSFTSIKSDGRYKES